LHPETRKQVNKILLYGLGYWIKDFYE